MIQNLGTHHTTEGPSDPTAQAPAGPESLLTVLSRRAGWVAVCIAIALGIGYYLHQDKPKQYRASSRLLVESDRPAVIDGTGSVVSSLPADQILVSVITGSDMLTQAARDDALRNLTKYQTASIQSIAGDLAGAIKVRPEIDENRNSNATVLRLECQSTDPEFCVAAVGSLTRAFESYLVDRRRSSMTELSNLIVSAREKLLPELTQLEDDYQAFRQTAPLQWNSTGAAINPYREERRRLLAQQDELRQTQQVLDRQLRSIRSFWERSKDLGSVLRVAATMLQRDDLIAAGVQPTRSTGSSIKVDDRELSRVSIEETLVPLVAQRDSLVASLAPSHPAVQQLDLQISALRREKQLLKDEEIARQEELSTGTGDESDESLAARRDAQSSKLKELIQVLQERIRIANDDIAALQTRIDAAKNEASKLSNFESDDAMYRRKIDRLQGLLNELEGRIATLSLTDEQAGLRMNRLSISQTAALVGPNLFSDLALFGMLGLLCGGGLGLIVDRAEKAFHSGEEITGALNLPILAYVPLDESKPKKKRHPEYEFKDYDDRLGVVHKPEGLIAEAVRSIRTRVFFDMADDEKVLMITSASAGDGKSTVAANLACSVAKAGRSVVLVDCDLRNPQVSRRFAVPSDKGLVTVLNGQNTPDEVIHASKIKGLDLLPCGPLPANPAEALSLPEFTEAIDWLRERYDFVVLDTPPVLAVADASIVAEYADRILMTLRIKRRSRPLAKEALSILRSMDRHVMGLVVNAYDESQLSVNYSYETQKAYGPKSEYRRQYRRSGGEALVEVTGRQGEVNGVSAGPPVDHADSRS